MSTVSIPFGFKPPLKMVEHNWSDTSIYDAEDVVICTFNLDDRFEVTEENQDDCERMQSEMIAYLVKAVNSHEKLVQFLRDVVLGDGRRVDFATALNKHNATINEFCPDLRLVDGETLGVEHEN